MAHEGTLSTATTELLHLPGLPRRIDWRPRPLLFGGQIEKICEGEMPPPHTIPLYSTIMCGHCVYLLKRMLVGSAPSTPPVIERERPVKLTNKGQHCPSSDLLLRLNHDKAKTQVPRTFVHDGDGRLLITSSSLVSLNWVRASQLVIWTPDKLLLPTHILIDYAPLSKCVERFTFYLKEG
jgi:hypothetical protein